VIYDLSPSDHSVRSNVDKIVDGDLHYPLFASMKAQGTRSVNQSPLATLTCIIRSLSCDGFFEANESRLADWRTSHPIVQGLIVAVVAGVDADKSMLNQYNVTDHEAHITFVDDDEQRPIASEALTNDSVLWPRFLHNAESGEVSPRRLYGRSTLFVDGYECEGGGGGQ
jgi:hypothetical protein